MKTALVAIDIQKGFHDPSWGPRNNPKSERHMEQVLALFRRKARPVIHVQHHSRNPRSLFRPGLPSFEFMDFAKPLSNEEVLAKSVNSAFIGTQLEARLRELEVSSLLMMGIATDHCLSTSARMAANLGFRVWMGSETSFTFDRKGVDGSVIAASEVHKVHLASLTNEFAEVLSQERLLSLLEDL